MIKKLSENYSKLALKMKSKCKRNYKIASGGACGGLKKSNDTKSMILRPHQTPPGRSV